MILGLALALTASQEPPSTDIPSFEREVRPLLMARCSGCHQPALLKGDLDLTTHAAIMAGADGESILNLGAPEESALLESVLPFEGAAADMPPAGPPLAAIQVDLLRRWIAAGAPNDTLDTGPRYTPESPPVYSRAPVIASISHSPDGALLAVSGLQETLLYNTADMTLFARLVGLSERITSARFSPDGTKLAVSGGTPAVGRPSARAHLVKGRDARHHQGDLILTRRRTHSLRWNRQHAEGPQDKGRHRGPLPSLT